MKKDWKRSIKEKTRFNHTEAAEYLGIADQTLYNWRHNRKGPDYIKFSRKPIYLKEDLDRFIESHRIKLTS